MSNTRLKKAEKEPEAAGLVRDLQEHEATKQMRV